MSTLHVLADPGGLAACVAATAPGDPVLLLGPALGLLDDSAALAALGDHPLHALDATAAPPGVTATTMAGFVALVEATERSVTWGA